MVRKIVKKSSVVAAAILAGLLVTSGARADGWYGVDPNAGGSYGKPYRYVCKIVTFWPNGEIRVGTGALIGRKHVLTAGHVLYNPDTGQSPSVVMVTPGEYYGKAPFGSANAVKWAVSRPFLQGNRMYDYGVVLLNRPLGDRTLGWFTLNDWQAGSYDVQIAGYTPLWNDGNSVLHGYDNVRNALTYPEIRWRGRRLSPLGGLSGAPAWFIGGGVFRLVGVYTSGDGMGYVNGVKLTTTIRREIQTWIGNNP